MGSDGFSPLNWADGETEWREGIAMRGDALRMIHTRGVRLEVKLGR